jgi:hypothetical protein
MGLKPLQHILELIIFKMTPSKIHSANRVKRYDFSNLSVSRSQSTYKTGKKWALETLFDFQSMHCGKLIIFSPSQYRNINFVLGARSRPEQMPAGGGRGVSPSGDDVTASFFGFDQTISRLVAGRRSGKSTDNHSPSTEMMIITVPTPSLLPLRLVFHLLSFSWLSFVVSDGQRCSTSL